MSRADESAFPVPATAHTPPVYGLTVREHFAALAMQALIGTSAAPCLTDCLGGAEAHCAAGAVKMADALIAELAKPVAEKPDAGADIERYLTERSEWLQREINNGGNLAYLSEKRGEVEYVLKNVREIRARTQP